jgi:uncharacterized protein
LVSSMYIARDIENFLSSWKTRSDRKPLIVRGARQVGKTRTIESWGRKNFTNIININLEKEPGVADFFRERDINVKKIFNRILLYKGIDLQEGSTLLFLDEIQNYPKVISALRYFYEDYSELYVICAGSLLDFALRELDLPVPVGRVEYAYLYPISFFEYIRAIHGKQLYDYLLSITINDTIDPPIHQKLLELLREYYFIGGMPEVVHYYVQNKDFSGIQRIQTNILQTMREDFAKYRSRASLDVVGLVFDSVARNPARRLPYVSISRDYRSAQLKIGYDLLTLARIIHPIQMSYGNGVPLGSEIKHNYFKGLFLDIALSSKACGLQLISNVQELITVREGALAEQFVGQELLCSGPVYEDTKLFYWERDKAGASAEVDYLIEHNGAVVPIEVKARAGNTLKSLHVFAKEKGVKYALRLSTREMNKEIIKVWSSDQKLKLISIPLYLASQVKRLLGQNQ